MKPVLGFLKTTLLGGIFFLLPLGITVIVLAKAVEFAAKLMHPITRLLPGKTVIGVTMPNLVAAVVLLAIAFAAGLVARTRVGTQIHERMERLILRRMPGYTLLKGMAQGTLGVGSAGDVKVALAYIDDAWLISFIIEHHRDGMLTVFVPSAPTPAAGNVYYMTEQQVRRLDVPVAAAVKCVMQLGVGTQELLERHRASEGKPGSEVV